MERFVPSTHRIDPGAGGVPVLAKRATDEAGRSRLRAESAVLRHLDHPGVVRFVELVDEPDAVELHLAWVGSHTLATVTGLTAVHAAELVALVADVVAHVHAAGWVHGRIRPDHVLLGSGSRPVLTGFAEAGPGDRGDGADDVADLGSLLAGLLAPRPEALALPARRRDPWAERRRARSGRGDVRRSQDRGLRGALLTLADQAQADDRSARPTAAELAELLRVTAGLPPGPPPRAGGGSEADRPRPARRRRSPGRVRSAGDGRTRRRAGLALVGCAGVGLLAAAVATGSSERGPGPGGAVARSVPAPGAGPSSVAVTGPSAPVAPSRSSSSPPVGEAPSPPSEPVPATSSTTDPSPCPPVGQGGHDVDGDGCPEAVRLAGERVSVGSTTWIVGRTGDRAAVGDWDCDGVATVAVLRPSTGEVFVYDGWAEPGAEVTVTPVARVEGATAIAGADGGEGCAELVVAGPGPGVQVVDGRAGRDGRG